MEGWIFCLQKLEKVKVVYSQLTQVAFRAVCYVQVNTWRTIATNVAAGRGESTEGGRSGLHVDIHHMSEIDLFFFFVIFIDLKCNAVSVK